MRWFGVIYPPLPPDEGVEWLARALQDEFKKHALIHAEILPEQDRTKVYLAFVDQVTKGPDPTTGTLAVKGVEPVYRYEFTEAQGLVLEATLFGTSCKYDGNLHHPCGFPCGFCWKKSFASSERAASADGWEPREKPLNSHKKLSFKCETCKHAFPAALFNITRGSGCPFCCNRDRCLDPACGHCRPRSFTSHPMAIYAVGTWIRGKALNSHVMGLFQCQNCPHTFEMSPSTVVTGKWCPYCGSSRRCPVSKNCGWCLDRSFATVKLPGELLDPVEAGEYPIFSTKIGKFKCQNNHEFRRMFRDVALGVWCPDCRDSTEQRVGAFLKDIYGTKCKDQPKAPCPDGQILKLDWRVEVSPGIYVSIELDGNQHFKDCPYFKNSNLAVIQARDVYKMLFCLARGDFIVRISQPDVYRLEHARPLQWRHDLQSAIEGRSSRIQYIEYGRSGSWSHLDTELAAWPVVPGVLEAWFGANSHRLKSDVPVPDPSAPGPETEDGPVNDDDVEAVRLALEQTMLVDTTGTDPAACNCGRPKGSGGRPHNRTCPASSANRAARLDEKRRLKAEAASAPHLVVGAGLSRAGHSMGTEAWHLDADQQECWTSHPLEILTLLKTVPAGCEDEAIVALSCDFDLPASFLWALLELERSM
jgi:Zn finger protein HypA/HybF involved in hydrogenase expression